MIIVIGRVGIRPDRIDEAIAASTDHVNRSRAEPGCVSHDVSVDAQNPSGLIFVEYWSDPAALQAHFALDASKQFFQTISAMSDSAPDLQIYQAEQLPPH